MTGCTYDLIVVQIFNRLVLAHKVLIGDDSVPTHARSQDEESKVRLFTP